MRAFVPGNRFFISSKWMKKTPSIEYVNNGEHFHLYFETGDVGAVAAGLKANGVTLVKDVHKTPWGTKELVIKDDQGHTLYFGEPQ